MAEKCASCGAPAVPGAGFCGACGAALSRETVGPLEPNGTSAESGPNTASNTVTINLPPSLSKLNRYLPGQEATATVPTVLWGAVALLLAAGLFVAIPSIWVLPNALGLLDEGDFGRSLGLFVTMMLLLLISFGGACLYLALKLIEADRSGRILSIILACSLGVGLLLGDDKSTDVVLAILGCAGVAAVLTLVEEVRAFFTGPQASQAHVADSVVAARSMVMAMSFGLGVTGLAFLPLGNLADRFVVIGLLLVAVAVVAFKFAGQLLSGDENARMIITGLMAADVVGILFLEPEDAGLFVPIALAVAVVGLLWGPDDPRRHFGSGS